MKENLKYLTKLASKAFFSFLKINVLGQLFIFTMTVISIVTIYYKTVHNTQGDHDIITIVSLKPIAFSLVLVLGIISAILLFTLGNKYITSKVINLVVTEKGETILYPLIDKVVDMVKAKQPEMVKKGVDKAQLKLKILQELKESSENKWLKRIIIFGLKRINLNDYDLNDDFSEIIKQKIIRTLQEITEPSKLFFWIICSVQIIILITIIILI